MKTVGTKRTYVKAEMLTCDVKTQANNVARGFEENQYLLTSATGKPGLALKKGEVFYLAVEL